MIDCRKRHDDGVDNAPVSRPISDGGIALAEGCVGWRSARTECDVSGWRNRPFVLLSRFSAADATVHFCRIGYPATPGGVEGWLL
jgi:hypothetical protein